MNNSELKEALFNQRPIIFNKPLVGELHYNRVSAVIYRVKDGRLHVSAEIEDKCGRSVMIVEPENIRYDEKPPLRG